MLRGLVEKEEQQYKLSPVSSLRLFARLDIGVCQNREDETFSFGLNEVESGHSTALFSQSAAHGTVDRLAPTLVHLWEKVILDKQQNIGEGNTEVDNMY
jgi:hypothetical protein